MPKPSQSSPAQIGYINVVPACLHPGGILKRPQFDSLRATIDKLNSLLDSKPLPGWRPQLTSLAGQHYVITLQQIRSIPARYHFALIGLIKRCYTLLTSQVPVCTGRIVDVETVRAPFRQYSTWVEPNRCHWRQARDVTASSISFVRLYYEACDSPHRAHLGETQYDVNTNSLNLHFVKIATC